MRFVIGLSSAIVGLLVCRAVGGAGGLVAGALALVTVHALASLVWQKLRKDGAARDPSQSPFLAGWFITGGLLLAFAVVCLVMGYQIDARHAWVSQHSVNDALLRDYPGKSVFEVGVLIGAAGLTTLMAGIVRWLEHRREAQGDAKLPNPS